MDREGQAVACGSQKEDHYMKKALLLFLIACLLLPSLGLAAESLRKPDDSDLTEGLYDAYFDDAVFVGDSVLRQLQTYLMEQAERGKPMLGKARFLSATKYTLFSASLKALTDRVQLRYQGREVTFPQGISQMEAGKVLVLLGLNDHAGSQLKKDIARYERIIDNAREAVPGIVFVAISMTPVAQGKQSKTLTQKNLDAFNKELEELCLRKEVPFINLAPLYKNKKGYLNTDLSNDKWVHLNDKGLAMMVDALRRFARDQYEQGQWTLEGVAP